MTWRRCPPKLHLPGGSESEPFCTVFRKKIAEHGGNEENWVRQTRRLASSAGQELDTMRWARGRSLPCSKKCTSGRS